MNKDQPDEVAAGTHDESATQALAQPIPIDRQRAYSAVTPPAPTLGYELAESTPVHASFETNSYDEWSKESAAQQKRRATRPVTGVRVGPFIGAVVVTSVIAALLVAVLAWVLELVIRWVPASYWESVEVIRTPSLPTDAYIGLAVAANLAFAGLLFGLIKLAIAPVGRWFSLLTGLLTALAVVAVVSAGGPWQHVVPTAIVVGVCGLAMSTWCRAYGYAATINRNDF